MIPRIGSWLEDVKRDLETPDLWAELRRETELLGLDSDDAANNTPFAPDEQQEILKRLQEFMEHASHTYSLSEAQIQILNEKLDYLAKATSRLGRMDWRNLAAGTILAFAVTTVLPPEVAREILQRFVHTVIGYLSNLPLLTGG